MEMMVAEPTIASSSSQSILSVNSNNTKNHLMKHIDHYDDDVTDKNNNDYIKKKQVEMVKKELNERTDVDGEEVDDNDMDEEKIRLLNIRKKYELKLIKKFDKSTISSKECWFIIDCTWLNQWSAFINGDIDEKEPGQLSTRDLLDDHGVPLRNLELKIDYRGVCPMVYFIFVELYGKDTSLELTRYVLDIYKPSVAVDKLMAIYITGKTQAKIHVNKIRPKWIKWERHLDEDEDDNYLCCGLTKEHIDAFIYWAITCWSSTNRKKSGRGNISYRDYKPLKYDDSLHDNNSSNGGSNHGSVHGGGRGGRGSRSSHGSSMFINSNHGSKKQSSSSSSLQLLSSSSQHSDSRIDDVGMDSSRRDVNDAILFENEQFKQQQLQQQQHRQQNRSSSSSSSSRSIARNNSNSNVVVNHRRRQLSEAEEEGMKKMDNRMIRSRHDNDDVGNDDDDDDDDSFDNSSRSSSSDDENDSMIMSTVGFAEKGHHSGSWWYLSR